jgi:hypothetical protein
MSEVAPVEVVEQAGLAGLVEVFDLAPVSGRTRIVNSAGHQVELRGDVRRFDFLATFCF